RRPVLLLRNVGRRARRPASEDTAELRGGRQRRKPAHGGGRNQQEFVSDHQVARRFGQNLTPGRGSGWLTRRIRRPKGGTRPPTRSTPAHHTSASLARSG